MEYVQLHTMYSKSDVIKFLASSLISQEHAVRAVTIHFRGYLNPAMVQEWVAEYYNAGKKES